MLVVWGESVDLIRGRGVLMADRYTLSEVRFEDWNFKVGPSGEGKLRAPR